MKRKFAYKIMDETTARDIITWQYPPPYDIYNCAPDQRENAVAGYLNPEFHYYSVWTPKDELVGFRCFGADATVPGGDYSLDAIDMGGGLKPSLTGKGLGQAFMQSAIDFAIERYSPQYFRATVAEFNLRAVKVCERVGYRKESSFTNEKSKKRFVIYLKQAEN